jgi:hypothetical protein
MSRQAWWVGLLALTLLTGQRAPVVWAEEASEAGGTGAEDEVGEGTDAGGEAAEEPGGETGGEQTPEPAPEPSEGTDGPDSTPDWGEGEGEGSEGEGPDPGNGGTDPEPPPPVTDEELKREAWTVFYDTLTREQQFYFMEHHDQGDFEVRYVPYHRDSAARISEMLNKVKAGERWEARLMTFVLFVHGKPGTDTMAEVTYYATNPDGSTRSFNRTVTWEGGMLNFGDFSLQLNGREVISITTAGGEVITLTDEQRFLVPPTVDRLFPNLRGSL